jgi:LysM repeat protein
LGQENQGRARVKIAISIVLAVHGIGLLALLMQGCRRDEPAPPPAPPEAALTNAAVVDTNPPAPEPATTAPPAPQPTVVAPPPEPPPAQEYVVAAGDSFSAIAKKLHVPLKELMNANPGVEPTKLQVGQKLHVPAPTTAPSATSVQPAAVPGETIYEVKSGDTLTKIASDFKTTIKALRSANNLTTDRIKVGQKLKIPVKAAVPETPAAAPSEAPAAAPAAPR